MRRGDLAAVQAIEEASYPYPWTRGIFSDCLRVGYHCEVLVVAGQLAGYCIHSRAMDEAHLLNLCIAPEHRGRGLGRHLLNHLLDQARSGHVDRLYLEVRPSNRSAIALYRALGFRVIGRRPGYYPAAEGREDAQVMVLHLDPRGG